jgi:hypothetical protein
MDPESCEMLLFLKYNYRFWANPMIIDAVIAKSDPDLDDVDFNVKSMKMNFNACFFDNSPVLVVQF